MKESLKEYLLTPQKEGFFSATKDSDAEEQRTTLSDRKILLATVSPCYSSSNDPSSVILQIPPLNQHQMLTSEAQGFSPLKQENKLPSIIGSTTLHALSSTNPFKYNVFNNNCVDSPMHPYLQACREKQQDNDPQFSENNQLIKLACENINAALRKDNPLVNGSIILKKPRFFVEFQDKNFMKDFQDSEYQKEVIRQLDFSNSFFCYDIPVISDKHKHITHSKKPSKSNENAKQSDNESHIVNSSSKIPSSVTFHQFPKKQLVPQSPQYYGYPFPGYFIDPVVPQMQIQPRVLRNDDKRNMPKSTTDKLGQPNKSSKLEETASKIGKVLFKPGSIEEISIEGEAQCEDHCQTMKHQENETENNNHRIHLNQQTEDPAQVKSQLSTVKKNKTEDILNQKRRHFDTPNSKKYDPSTPSTKKKCLEEYSSSKQGLLQAFTTAQSRQENVRNDELKQQVSEEKQKSELKHHESENEDEESYQEEIDDQADENSSKKECCGCKKTKCLKLYCECFQAKRYCVGTNCQGCHNRPEFEDLRQQAMESIKLRNNSAFEPKVDKIDEVFESTSGQKIHSKGCNCKKSDCRKKYCECFQMGAKCTHLCKCQNCKNGSSSSVIDANAHPVFFVDSNAHPPHYRGHPQQPYCYYPPQRYGPYGQQWNHHFYQPQDAIDQKVNRESDLMDYEDSHPQPDPTPKFSNRKTKMNQNNGTNAIPLFEGTNRVD